jgi:hypothetical protein
MESREIALTEYAGIIMSDSRYDLRRIDARSPLLTRTEAGVATAAQGLSLDGGASPEMARAYQRALFGEV